MSNGFSNDKLNRIKIGNLNTTNRNTHNPKLQGKILLVDDDKASQLVAVFLIDEFGVSYDSANDGKEALGKTLGSPLHLTRLKRLISAPKKSSKNQKK